MVHWNTAIAVATRALQDAQRRLSEHQELMAAGKRQAETLNQRLIEGASGLDQIEIEKRALHEQVNDLDVQIEEIRRQIEPAEVQLGLVEKEDSDLQAILVAAQQAVTVSDRHTTQTHLELTRVREALDSCTGVLKRILGW